MTCSVCGKDLGLWTKISGRSDSGICKECHEQGRGRLETLVRSVDGAQNWNEKYAQGWLNTLEEIVRKYCVQNADASLFRFSLLNNIFKLVEAETEISDSHQLFLIELAKKYSFGQSSPPELRDTVFRIGTRDAIQKWERGVAPLANCGGLVLQKGEVCHWQEAAGLRLQRVQRHYEGGYASVSVPVGLVKGMRVRVGGFKGYPIDETVLEDGGVGLLHVTNQRVCFVGQRSSIAIPFKKMISLQGFETGFRIETSNEKKPGIFIVSHPELTVQLLNLASSGRGEEEPPKSRRQKSPSAV